MDEINEREAQLGIACGEKGAGKTYYTIKVHIANALTGKGGKYKPKKVLIFDINDEYGDVQKEHKNPNFPQIKALDVNDIDRWIKQPNGKVAECRRISCMKPKTRGKDGILRGGGKMNHKELQETLSKILDTFRHGLLIIEDLTNYVSDSLPSDLIGSIITQRHVSVDVIIHFQSISKSAHPQLFANANWIRFHKTGDTVRKNAKKLEGTDLVPLYIAERMIHEQVKRGNKQNFCVFYHKNTTGKLVNKITGRFNQPMFKKGIEDFLSQPKNKEYIREEEDKEDLYSGKKIHKSRKAVIDHLIEEYKKNYYGNPDYGTPPSSPAKKIVRPNQTHLQK